MKYIYIVRVNNRGIAHSDWQKWIKSNFPVVWDEYKRYCQNCKLYDHVGTVMELGAPITDPIYPTFLFHFNQIGVNGMTVLESYQNMIDNNENAFKKLSEDYNIMDLNVA